MAAALGAGRGLALRPLNLRDAKALFALVEANRPRLGRWLPWPATNLCVQDSRAYILRVRALARSGLGQSFGLWWQDRLVGIAGFVWIDAAHRSGAIGYWLAEEAEGHGLMTAAVKTLLRHGFRTLKLNRIEIRAGVRNHRSRAIPRRLGFRHEGTLRQAERLGDRFVDHAVYSLLASEWRGR
ncbi:MAG: GNAT family N-acetyltransferase [Holophagaceae bacterium]|jgi:ribosomal-protein-serine acetyltransferase|uniref:GNAT family N-acetyltransferase n=1 Tax=Candidatus Geothrix odensensis TaxID=2954440 RepID=A0A936F0Z4_9BACT|nr:GNAT family N-acetyltransferase [Candidatus Geothrix odensensis]MBK8789732.1 GNAT family N-acetyltransferase [Holophagaceae bacterium]